ncbi:COG1361 S-layer family protein [Haloplanus pelagicus]|jgi:hypothetical protein|uniref:COG1361 S-layer family protein n=1 Tax=Haloplanus pelagicus TaxID=2949995 RepID=UPI00203DF512|nr:COG1361 S-layer family protein [Haloplanus sp. HW8-1]
MTGRRALGAVVALTLLFAAVSPALGAGQVIGSPEIAVFSPDHQVTPGEEVSLPVYLSNSGDLRRAGPSEYVDRVTTARGLTFTVMPGSAPIEVNTGRYPAGSVPVGTAGPYPVSITVAEDATPGTYRIPVRVQYTYTLFVDYGTTPPEFVDSYHDQRYYLTLSIRDVPRFEIVDAASTVGVGGRGNVSVTVRNVGTAPARDATLRLDAPSEELRLGSQSTGARAFAGTWAPGENRTFEFTASATSDAVVREYPLTGRVSYRDRDGVERTSRNVTTGITPLVEQTFATTNVSGVLHVGEPGTIRGTITNTGPRTVHDAVLVYRSSNPNLDPTDAEVALGRLAPGERRSFTFEVDVADRATPTTQQLNLTVRYRDDRRNRQVSDPLEPSVQVAPERDWLVVTPEAATVDVDTENRLAVRVRNVARVPLRDVVARIFVTAPFSTESRHAYVAALGPNETATFAFGLTVSEDAVPTHSSVTMNVTGERPDGEVIPVGTYEVPVTVTAPSGPTDTAVLAAWIVAVVVLLVGGGWWLRR